MFSVEVGIIRFTQEETENLPGGAVRTKHPLSQFFLACTFQLPTLSS